MFSRRNKKYFILGLIILLTASFFVFSFDLALAQDDPEAGAKNSDVFGLQPVDDNIGLASPDVRTIIAKIIRAVLGLLGIIALVIVLYGGYTYMTAGGNEEKINKAKKILINGVIGLIIILSAFAIVQFVINALSEATGLNKIDKKCVDPAYAWEHPEECDDPSWPASCEDQHFVVQSITPRTDNTGMNNASLRFVFSRRIHDMSASEIGDYINVMYSHEDISDRFAYEILGNDKGNHDKNSVIEAVYKESNEEKCDINTPCLPFGKYEVSVSTTIKDEAGNPLEYGDVGCGVYPEETHFIIGEDIQGVLKFDGGDGYVDITSASEIYNSQDITVEAWLTPEANGGIIGDGHKYRLYISNEKLYWWTREENNGDTDIIKANLNLGNRYHIVGTYNSTQGESYLYINGVEEKSSKPGFILAVGDDNQVIGDYYRGSPSPNFNGLIDEVHIYARSLSTEEVADHYNEGEMRMLDANEAGLVAAWDFNESWGEIAYDFSGHDNDGIIKGSVDREIETNLTPNVLGFDGGAGVELAAAESLNFGADNFSISLWFKPTGLPDGTHALWQYPNSYQTGYLLNQYGDNFYVYVRSAGPVAVVNNYFTDYINKWLYITVVYNNDNGTVSIYRNGDLIISKSGINWEALPDDKKTFIGKSNFPGIVGLLDEARIYNRALSATEVEDIYQLGRLLYDETNFNQGLVGAWHFDSGEASDYSGNGNDGVVKGAVGEISEVMSSEFTRDTIDPVLTPIEIVYFTEDEEGEKQEKIVTDGKLYKGNSYFFHTEMTDNSGSGYVKLDLEKWKLDAEGNKQLDEAVHHYYRGPLISRGSDSPVSNPYIYNHRLYFNRYLHAPQRYQLALTGWDIDYNFDLISSAFVLYGAHCNNGIEDKDLGEEGVDTGGECPGGNGAACGDDADCAYSYRCVNVAAIEDPNDKRCKSFPLIEDVDPMDGAAGNWITVIGHNFGSDVGIVQFGYDKDHDGVIKSAEIEADNEWVNAEIVTCGPLKEYAWNNNYVVVEVPGSIENFSTSSIRLIVSSAIAVNGIEQRLFDLSTPYLYPASSESDFTNSFNYSYLDIVDKDWGPNPGPRNGWFEKNTIKRPGLCTVETTELFYDKNSEEVGSGARGAPPDTKIMAWGKAFGTEQGNSNLYFGSKDNSTQIKKDSDWSDNTILTKVPNLSFDTYGVYARIVKKEGDIETIENSNKVLFDVLDKSTIEVPVISAIDPPITTPKSYITIYGSGFGSEEGRVYISPKADGKSCGSDCELNTSLPSECGDTWQDEQVIVEIPEDIFANLDAEQFDLWEEINVLEINGGLPLAGTKVVEDIVGGDFAESGPYILTFKYELTAIDPEVNPEYFNETSLAWQSDRTIFDRDTNNFYVRETHRKNGDITREFRFYEHYKRAPYFTSNIGVLLSDEKQTYDPDNPDEWSAPVEYKIVKKDNILSLYKNGGKTPVAEVDLSQVVGADDRLAEKYSNVYFGVASVAEQYQSPTKLRGSILDFSIKMPGTKAIVSYLTLETAQLKLKTKGNDKLTIKDSPPLPSICMLEPEQGPAPLPKGNAGLKLVGANFPASLDDLSIYFWHQGAKIDDMSSDWLVVNSNSTINTSTIIKNTSDLQAESPFIRTLIPVSDEDGTTMPNGASPIKIRDEATEEYSNSVAYTVSDCREASDELLFEMKEQAYRCCGGDEGADTGMWKPNYYLCDGESREAGYTWRFTTGMLPDLPYVVEECDEVNWGTDEQSLAFPSPIPWENWVDGTDSCLNGVVAVRFSRGMDEDSFNFGTVKLFKCDQAGDCKNAEEIDLAVNHQLGVGEQGGYLRYESGVLKINIPPPDLEANTWYHVELLEGIQSQKQVQEAGVSITVNEPLRKDRPCDGLNNNDTAYCYDFKTGDGLCVLIGAGIVPDIYTTHLLGIIQDDRYEFYDGDDIFDINKILHPFYYYINGWGDQPCSVLNVDGMGWQWEPQEGEEDSEYATAEIAAGSYYTDSRAIVKAWWNTAPDFVNITASIEGSPSSYNVLEEVNNGNSITGKMQVPDIDAGGFAKLDEYTVTIRYQLNNVTQGGDFGKVFYGTRTEHVLFDRGNTNKIYVAETHYQDGRRTRQFRFHEFYEDIPLTRLTHLQTYNDIDDEAEWNAEVEFSIVKINGVISLYRNGKEVAKRILPANYQPRNKSGYVYLGGSQHGEWTTMSGSINEFKIEISDKEITGTSKLTIDLSNPEVIDYWPDCEEACINSSLGARFNMLMMTDTYEGNIKLYECASETCQEDGLSLYEENLTIDDSEQLEVRIQPDMPGLKPSTWYLVKLTEGIKAVGGYEKNEAGEITKELEGKSLKYKEWRFRTKEDGTPCMIDVVNLEPDPFAAVFIGEKVMYKTVPHGAPDQCNPVGQELNPWWFGWEWQSQDTPVAQVTNFATNISSNPFCTLGCLLSGSDVNRDKATDYICGNGQVDPGEDCDIDDEDEIIGQSCTYNCLRPGNVNTGEGAGQCGNGIEETKEGEECDDGNTGNGDGCSSVCLWEGSPATPPSGVKGVSWCGSGDVTNGEECDIDITTSTADPINESQIGCSSQCLHEGTELAQSWCDKNGDLLAEAETVCETAISVCGNSILESGEECEITKYDTHLIVPYTPTTAPSSPTTTASYYCSDRCLLQNICELDDKSTLETAGLWCEKGSAGCNLDCTLAGSSVTYADSSLCGDGDVGVGEYGSCDEVESDSGTGEITSLGAVPIQIATAVGESDVTKIYDDVVSQYTQIEATAKAFWLYIDEDTSKATYLNEKYEDTGKLKYGGEKTGTGDYYLKCGFVEFAEPVIDGDKYQFNDCTQNSNNDLGVAHNSCCYPRSQRQAEYPADGAGFAPDDPDLVCRNTYIKVVFDKEIDEQSLKDNVLLAAGYQKGDHICTSTTENVTDLVNLSLSELAYQAEAPQGFWSKLWQGIKGFFVRLLGLEAYATRYASSVDHINSWCSGGVKLTPEVHYEFTTTTSELGEEITLTTSTIVSLYIDNVLEADKFYAVVLRGGLNGVKDVKGVGIKSFDGGTNVNDLWLFRTGEAICKIKSITVDPDNYLFDKPNDSFDFEAITQTTNGQQIVSTPAYLWEWHWAPATSQVFKIPVPQTPTNTNWAELGSTNMEGNLKAVAQAKILEDYSKTDSHKGQVFIGVTDLAAMFCENPWPVKIADTWGPFVNDKYNFSMSYCADSGVSGNTEDDLPFFDKEFKFDKEIQTINRCSLTGQICTTNNDCQTEICFNETDDDGDGDIDCEDLDCLQDPLCVDTNIISLSNCLQDGWQEGATYKLTRDLGPDDLVDTPFIGFCMRIGANNITLDCQNHEIVGRENGRGIGIHVAPSYISGVTIKNCKVRGFAEGIRVSGESTTVENSSFVNNVDYGINYILTNKSYSLNNIACNNGKSDFRCAGSEQNQGDGNIFGDVIACADNNWPQETVNYTSNCDQIDLTNSENICQPAEELSLDQSLTTDTLVRYIFFNEVNEDALGLQIFENPSRLSAAEWYKEQFPDAGSLQTVSVAGYDTVKDGDNYYINALNLVTTTDSDYVLYNNIYQFSLNQAAQGNSHQVLEQLLDSLQFNINITDHEYCLNSGAVWPDDPNNYNDQLACKTDFDCHDVDGNLLEETSGVCSNAETKFFRDLERIKDIRDIQDNISNHFINNYGTLAFKGNLLGGTYIPGYTNSLWPSWNGTLGAAVGNLPVEKVNAWTTCSDSGAESQTCWNAASSTYSCPAYSSIYEYEFRADEGSYMLYGPLEFFKEENNIVKETINSDNFTTEPYCQSQTYSPFGKECGDGILQPGEACEPPGQFVTSDYGVITGQVGRCEDGYTSDERELACIVNEDCGYHLSWNGESTYFSDKNKVCQVSGNVIRDSHTEIIREVEIKYAFGCEALSDCRNANTYKDRLYGAENGSVVADVNGQEENIAYADLQDWLQDNKDFLSCEGVLVTKSGGGVIEQVECEGGRVESEGYCSELGVGYFAYEVCSDNCQWEYGSCELIYDCGNGIVEEGEDCDDGALNGSYGHCSSGCLGFYEDFCGNGEIDYKNDSPLEVCDKLPAVQTSLKMNLGQCNNTIGSNKRYCFADRDCDSALSFSGNDYLEYTSDHINNLIGSNSFSVELWLQRNTGVDRNKEQTFFYIGDSAGSHIALILGADQGLTFKSYEAATHGTEAVEKNVTVAPGYFYSTRDWYHIVITFDTEYLRIFLNGEEKYREITEIPTIDTAELYLGAPPPISNSSFFGKLDEVHVYNKVLSAGEEGEILANYNGGQGMLGSPEQPGLVVGWHFDEKIDDQAYDYNLPERNPALIQGAEWVEAEIAQSSCLLDDIDEYTRLVIDKPWLKFVETAESCGDDVVCKFFTGLFYSTVHVRMNNMLEGSKYCEGDKQLLCLEDDDCKAPPINSHRIFTENDFNPKDVAGWQNLFHSSFTDFGPCIDKNGDHGSAYNYYKEFSCAWDCQSYGSYCGDGQQDIKEECDDGNDSDIDDCHNNCTKNITAVCGNGIPELEEECDDGNNDKGDGCSPICHNEPPDYQVCGDGEIDWDEGEACDRGEANGQVCNPAYNDSCTYCSYNCEEILTIDSEEYCGDGEIQIDHELCDVDDSGQVVAVAGAQICPDKGEYQCLNDCQTLDSSRCVECQKNFDKALPHIAILNPLIPYTLEPYGVQKDWWSQYYDTDYYGNNDHFKLGVYRTSTSDTVSSFLGTTPLIEDVYHPNPSQQKYLLSTAQSVDFDSTVEGLETDVSCNDEYQLFFNYKAIANQINLQDGDEEFITPLSEANFASEHEKIKNYGDLFTYYVNDEYDKIYRDLILSPPVPEGVFRVIIKYGYKDEWQIDARFAGNLFNIALSNPHVRFTEAAGITSDMLCMGLDYETDCEDKNYSGVYVHDEVDLFVVNDESNYDPPYIQSMTIDTREITSGNYAFYVNQYLKAKMDEFGESMISPIYDFKSHDISVEIYGYHNNQILEYSVYGPIAEFSLTEAEVLGDASSKYWHVFNIVQNDQGEYIIDTVKDLDISWNIVGDFSDGVLVIDENSIFEKVSQ